MNITRQRRSLSPGERLLPRAHLLLLLWLAAALCSGCEVKTPEQASMELASSLSPTPTPAAPPGAGRSQTRRVYIDASLSMKGFANASASTTFARLIEGLGYDLDGATVYKYGQVGRQEPRRVEELLAGSAFGRDLISPAFYDRDFNPDAALISHLTGEEQLAFSVLITDGVYSVQGGDNSSQVVEAIGKWLDRGGAFGIFAFKSPFAGNIYAERRPVTLPNVEVGARPFYAFVFSPTLRELRHLEERLKARALDMLTFVLADEVVDIKADFDEATRGTYSYARPPNEPYHWHMLTADIFDRQNPSPVGYSVRYLSLPDYPASSFRVDLSADYYRWNKGTRSFYKIAEGPPRDFGFKMEEAGPEAAGGQLEGGQEAGRESPPNLTVFFPKDGDSDYSFYSLRLLLSPKELRQEIQGLSTYNDDERVEANKTYRFYDLVAALTQLHFNRRLAPRVTPPLFVTIANY